MANLGIPASLQRSIGPVASDVDNEVMHLTRVELNAQLDTVRNVAFEEGVAKGREQLEEQAENEVVALQQALREQLVQVEGLHDKLEKSLREVTAAAEDVRGRIEEAADIAATKIALKLLFELESSEEMISSVVATIVEDFHPTAISIKVDPSLVEGLAKRFADDAGLEVAEKDETENLSIRFHTDGGSFEYCTREALAQLKQMVDKGTAGQS